MSGGQRGAVGLENRAERAGVAKDTGRVVRMVAKDVIRDLGVRHQEYLLTAGKID